MSTNLKVANSLRHIDCAFTVSASSGFNAEPFGRIPKIVLDNGPLHGMIISGEVVRDYPIAIKWREVLEIPTHLENTDRYLDGTTFKVHTAPITHVYVRMREKETDHPVYEYVPPEKVEQVKFERGLLRVGEMLEPK